MLSIPSHPQRTFFGSVGVASSEREAITDFLSDLITLPKVTQIIRKYITYTCPSEFPGLLTHLFTIKGSKKVKATSLLFNKKILPNDRIRGCVSMLNCVKKRKSCQRKVGYNRLLNIQGSTEEWCTFAYETKVPFGHLALKYESVLFKGII